MASYEYPTPPPTSSPKNHHNHNSYQSFSPKLAAQDSYYQDTQHPSSRIPQVPSQVELDMPSRTYTDPPYQQKYESAQESYYKTTPGSFSTPASPTHHDYGHNSAKIMNEHQAQNQERIRMGKEERTGDTTTTTYEYLPPRRRSSPIIPTTAANGFSRPTTNGNETNNPYYTGTPDASYQSTNNPPISKPSRQNISYTTPLARPTSPLNQRRRTPPRPIYFSPTNPVPTPYSSSRATPRPGFLKRMFQKFKSFLRRLLSWARHNPIKAGFLSFLPVIAGVGLVKLGSALGLGGLIAGSGLGKFVAMVGGGLVEGMGGGVSPSKAKRQKEKEVENTKGRKEGEDAFEVDFSGKGPQGIKEEIKKEVQEKSEEWGYGLDHFVGFGGTKNGPLDGIMKVALMGVNQYCKLTPSAIPRAASILLELYFLDAAQKKL